MQRMYPKGSQQGVAQLTWVTGRKPVNMEGGQLQELSPLGPDVGATRAWRKLWLQERAAHRGLATGRGHSSVSCGLVGTDEGHQLL